MHLTRLCPKQTRCSKCGDRGHDLGACKSKLKSTNLDPCEFCGGADHVEASCTERFFPARTEHPDIELRLWISCAQCGSKEHLAGDCPISGSTPAPAWSLRAYSHDKIINLGLQTGAQAREKDAQSKGIRPEGMQIKGRGGGRGASNPNKYQQRGPPAQFEEEEEDDFTTRIASTRSRQPSPRTHIRFGDDGRGRMPRGDADDYYRKRSDRPGMSNDYDGYHPPPPPEYRDRNSYGGRRGYQDDGDYHDRRPRSRSPPRYGGQYEGDTWRPPLPRGPPPHVSLPARPALPRKQQQQSQNSSQRPSKKGKRGTGKGKGGEGGVSVKPMPFAAKKAWNKGRL